MDVEMRRRWARESGSKTEAVCVRVLRDWIGHAGRLRLLFIQRVTWVLTEI
jgi:hypothetical protein